MEKQIQNIQNEMIQEFQEYSKTYILNIIETLVTNNMLWRCYSYSGWNILKTMDIHYRIIGIEYKDKPFTGKDICEQRGIGIVYNSRDHNWSTTELRKRIIDKAV